MCAREFLWDAGRVGVGGAGVMVRDREYVCGRL